ncbi:Uncharacterised protein [Chlamydia trachomatis]|nr:Uncharacterised protein [Chlamydia trachomatis]
MSEERATLAELDEVSELESSGGVGKESELMVVSY